MLAQSLRASPEHGRSSTCATGLQRVEEGQQAPARQVDSEASDDSADDEAQADVDAPEARLWVFTRLQWSDNMSQLF